MFPNVLELELKPSLALELMHYFLIRLLLTKREYCLNHAIIVLESVFFIFYEVC